MSVTIFPRFKNGPKNRGHPATHARSSGFSVGTGSIEMSNHTPAEVLGCFGLRQGASGVLVLNALYGLCLVPLAKPEKRKR